MASAAGPGFDVPQRRARPDRLSLLLLAAALASAALLLWAVSALKSCRSCGVHHSRSAPVWS